MLQNRQIRLVLSHWVSYAVLLLGERWTQSWQGSVEDKIQEHLLQISCVYVDIGIVIIIVLIAVRASP